MKVTRKGGKIAALTQAIAGLSNTEGRVGWFESAKYENGAPVAGVAAVQEFGSTARSIPPRLGMRTTAIEQKSAWARMAAQATKAVALGKLPADGVMEAVCQRAAADMRRTITKVTSPPLSYITLMARKHRKGEGKRVAKVMKYGPAQPERAINGRMIGEFARKLNAGPPNLSGVSTKPLVDSGILLGTLTSQVTTK